MSPQEQPLVSIILPVYNAQDHIARCIESIRAQTHRNIEIIILNDGSKDVSFQVCERKIPGCPTPGTWAWSWQGANISSSWTATTIWTPITPNIWWMPPRNTGPTW